MRRTMMERGSGHNYPGLLWQTGMVLLFNTLIALTLALLNSQGQSWSIIWPMLIYSHSIGLSIFTISHLLALRHPCNEREKLTPLDLVLGIALGSVLGSVLGGFFTGTLDYLLANSMAGLGANIMLGILFGTAIGHYFFATYKMTWAKLELQQRENRQLSAEKELAETQLRLLQAQIEPHFLFNTLSTIHGLIETEPRLAATVLESLSDYLRASLRRSREGVTTLGDELALIRAYLAIQKTRLGERLNYRCDIPEHLLDLHCPPMLVQPLVENAVLHGIEPSMQGGELTLRAREEGGALRIEVVDSGMGLGGNRAGHGLGLNNIRERLAALYGEAARLELGVNAPQGVRAVLVFPFRIAEAAA